MKSKICWWLMMIAAVIYATLMALGVQWLTGTGAFA